MDNTESQRGAITTTVSTNFTDQDSNLITHSLANPQIIILNTSDMTGGIPDWRVSDIIIATYDSQGITLFENWQVRLRLISKDITSGDWSFELIGITSEQLEYIDQDWSFLLERTAALFEFKFPRFGYRYKYQDGEYSAFSPFSRVAFLPGPFDYNPEKGYNLGMRNELRNLKIKDFIEEDSVRPHGVVSIDLLYKESNSPNVYTVKTINTDDPEWSSAGTNPLSLSVSPRHKC